MQLQLRWKTIVGILMVLALSTAGLAAWAQTAGQGAGAGTDSGAGSGTGSGAAPEMTFDVKPGKVLFKHQVHEGRAPECKTCHHAMQPDQPMKKCTACHQQKADANCKLPRKEAFHKQCLDCHKKVGKTAPVKCFDCHIRPEKKKKGAPGGGPKKGPGGGK